MAEEDDNIPSCSSKAICAVIDWPDQLKSEDELLHITQYPGVYWEKKKKKWQAQRMRNYKKFDLGRFDTDKEAYIAVLEFDAANPPQDKGTYCQKARAYGRSMFKGVTYDKHKAKCWRVEIRKDGRKYYLGSFATEEAAARAYDKKCLELRGPEARLNFPVKT